MVVIGVEKIVALLQSCCSQTTFVAVVVVAVAYDDTSDAGETTAGWGLKWIYGDVDSDGGDVVVVVHDRKVVGKIVIDCERRVVGL